jgi:hypothetical protein
MRSCWCRFCRRSACARRGEHLTALMRLVARNRADGGQALRSTSAADTPSRDGCAGQAERAGFGSASTFSAAFGRHVGSSPSRYARACLNIAVANNRSLCHQHQIQPAPKSAKSPMRSIDSASSQLRQPADPLPSCHPDVAPRETEGSAVAFLLRARSKLPPPPTAPNRPPAARFTPQQEANSPSPRIVQRISLRLGPKYCTSIRFETPDPSPTRPHADSSAPGSLSAGIAASRSVVRERAATKRTSAPETRSDSSLGSFQETSGHTISLVFRSAARDCRSASAPRLLSGRPGGGNLAARSRCLCL